MVPPKRPIAIKVRVSVLSNRENLENRGGTFMKNIGNHFQDYVASQRFYS
jgi:hypothetical protein